MIKPMVARASLALTLVVLLLADRARRWRTGSDRGDETIKVVLYAVLALTLGALAVGAISAVVNGKIALIK